MSNHLETTQIDLSDRIKENTKQHYVNLSNNFKNKVKHKLESGEIHIDPTLYGISKYLPKYVFNDITQWLHTNGLKLDNCGESIVSLTELEKRFFKDYGFIPGFFGKLIRFRSYYFGKPIRHFTDAEKRYFIKHGWVPGFFGKLIRFKSFYY